VLLKCKQHSVGYQLYSLRRFRKGYCGDKTARFACCVLGQGT